MITNIHIHSDKPNNLYNLDVVEKERVSEDKNQGLGVLSTEC